MRWNMWLVLLVGTGCTGTITSHGSEPRPADASVELLPWHDAAPGSPSLPSAPDGGGVAPPDAGVSPPVDPSPPPPATGRRAAIPLDVERPVRLMRPDLLARIADLAPVVQDPSLLALLESSDTVWYDRRSIIPGYQDSFGDNVITPIGMRPNTIDPGLINLAVPGGHGQIFVDFGVFHFPFGRPTGAHEDDVASVNFWQPPRGSDGRLLPVVYWQRDPNSYTHRVEWLFPRGTVLGEVLFIVDAAGGWTCFEIRMRTRELDGWRNDVFRPFPRATDLADALERTRTERSEWVSRPEISALVAHLRDPATLRPARLAATHFPGAFPPIDGAEDLLPALEDDEILRVVLRETPFRSARGAVWKESGSLRAYAPASGAGFHVVPRGYTGGFLEVNDATCARCHRDAGRPFRDWYDNITAYGELWGEDESFSWHPFATDRFVDPDTGRVREFNYDNREMRSDFLAAGLLEAYEPSRHSDTVYQSLPGTWKGYAY